MSVKKEIIQAIKDFDIHKLEVLLDDDRPYMEVSKKDFLKALKQSFDDARDQGLQRFDDTFFGICGTCQKGCEGITFYGRKRLQYLDLVFDGDDDQVIDISCCDNLQNFNGLEKQIDFLFSFYLDEKVAFKPSEDYQTHKKYYCEFLADLNVNVGATTLRNLVQTFEKYEQLYGFLSGDKCRVFSYRLYSNISLFRFVAETYFTIDQRSEHAVNALIAFQNAKTERDKVVWYFDNRADFTKVYGLVDGDGKVTKTKKHDIGEEVLIVDWSEYEYVVDYFDKLDGFYHEMCEKYEPNPDDVDLELYGIENYFRLNNVYLDLLDFYGEVED